MWWIVVTCSISQKPRPRNDWNQQNNHEQAMDSNNMTMNFKWIEKKFTNDNYNGLKCVQHHHNEV